MKRNPGSLRSGLLTTIVACWLLPILIVVAVAGILLGDSFERSVQQEINSGAESALRQVQNNLTNVITDSKAVSYDGVVRNAYRDYCENGDGAQLYRQVNEYLNQNFSRTDRYEAVFISFWEPDIPLTPYAITKGTAGYSILRSYQAHSGGLLELMADADTNISFLVLDGKLYMARNLMDSTFTPYASVVSLLDVQAMFFPLEAITRAGDLQITLDDCRFQITPEGTAEVLSPEVPQGDLYYAVEVDNHTLAFGATATEYNIWEYAPWLRWALLLVSLLVFPLLAVVIVLFYRNVTRPMEILAEAHRHIQAGQRGYVIPDAAPNAEFHKLYDHFNAMSTELHNQFERSYLEQQATQQAKIKALQSQINPHFLNNTLEIINWEARLAEDERVCNMIEALSTMLDAALDRDGRSQIPLREELGYVDAYLYIIRQRLGEGLHITKQIDGEILEQLIPRLILQPLVENAIEHDLTSQRGGSLWIRAFREENRMVLEVEHDGAMTEADREKVRKLLSASPGTAKGAQVGLRNVSQRLKLLYGDSGSLSLAETGCGTILARICFPV